jgi:hypothetical protein
VGGFVLQKEVDNNVLLVKVIISSKSMKAGLLKTADGAKKPPSGVTKIF